MKTANCTYYGDLDGKRYTEETASMLGVDEAFRRILERHEEKFIKIQTKLLSDVRRTFAEEIRIFNKKLSTLQKQIESLEKKFEMIKTLGRKT